MASCLWIILRRFERGKTTHSPPKRFVSHLTRRRTDRKKKKTTATRTKEREREKDLPRNRNGTTRINIAYIETEKPTEREVRVMNTWRVMYR